MTFIIKLADFVYILLAPWVLYGQNFHPVITLGRMLDYYADGLFYIYLSMIIIAGCTLVIGGLIADSTKDYISK